MAAPDSAAHIVLEAIPLSKLADLDDNALDQLLQVATKQGFFHLDLRENVAEHILQNMRSLFGVAAKLYSMPLETKSTFDIDTVGKHKLNGYKPAGRNVGVEGNKRDGFEAWLIPRDGIATPALDIPTPLLPPTLNENLRLLSTLMDQLHNAGTIILRALSLALGLPNEQSLELKHRIDRSSTSALGLLRYDTQCQHKSMSDMEAELNNQSGHAAHTDVGSITLLFCSRPGLQILDYTHDEWLFVAPRPGFAIVNIGDSLRFLSGGRLRSCLHRVLQYPERKEGKQQDEGFSQADTSQVFELANDARYSCAYFLRPERDVVFRDDNDREWTGIGWHEHKYGLFRANKMDQEKESYVLTGRKDYLGQWNLGEKVE